MAETAATLAYFAGNPTGPPVLPAAATRSSPLFHALLQIVSTALGALGAPRLMLAIRMSRLMHQSIPEISQLKLPLPVLLRTLTA